MLDDQNYIEKYDKQDALGVIGGQPQQLAHKFEVDVSGLKRPAQIVLAGMGGSALAGDITRAVVLDKLPVPFSIERDYVLPGFVGAETLVITYSYSGNTEETVAALEEARRLGAQVLVVSAGGKLAEIAREHKLAYIQLPEGLQPRLAVLYGVKALATSFDALELTKGLTGELESAGAWLQDQIVAWVATRPESDNEAKRLASAVCGHPAVVYAGPTLGLAALKWKIDINENAKNVAFTYRLPEWNHNEFIGWANPKHKDFKVIELQSELDHPKIARRFEVSNRLLSGNMLAPIIVAAQGRTKLEQLLWAILLGDYVSAYLAFMNQVDPMPVDLVEKLKKELA